MPSSASAATSSGSADPFPDLLAPMLAQLLAPGQDAEVGALLEVASALDDAALADFLNRLSNRILDSGEPITAAEVAQLMTTAVEPPG